MSETLAEIGEFGLIDRIDKIVRRQGIQTAALNLGIGDDCASFRPRAGFEVLVTCDCIVEGRHYLPDHITPLDLGRRSMTLNISDIGAMGGTPLYALVSLGLRSETPVTYVEALYHGFLEELNPLGAVIIGGNVTKSQGGIFIDITLIGEVEKDMMVRRSTAQAGDSILVTGYPGMSAAGLLLLCQTPSGKDLRDNPLVRAYNTPCHRAREGQAIARSGYATAMIDTSDGLLGDLGHVCQESGVGAVLFQKNLPVNEALQQIAPTLGKDPYELILGDSDDYELMITCPPGHVDRIRSAVSSISDVPVSEVGCITDATGGVKLMLPDETQREIVPSGWDHFSK